MISLNPQTASRNLQVFVNRMIRTAFYEGDFQINVDSNGAGATLKFRPSEDSLPLIRYIGRSNITMHDMPNPCGSMKALQEKEEGKDASTQTSAVQPFLFRKFGDQCDRCNVIKCGNCSLLHEVGRCFATARECHYCGGVGHYKAACPKKKRIEAEQAVGRRDRPEFTGDHKV